LSEEDLAFEEIRDTVQASLDSKRAAFPRFEDDPFPVLSSLGMETRGGFTNAADICFGRDPAARHSQVRLRAFAFETDKGGDFVDQQVFSGPIVQMIEQAVAFIRGSVAVTAEFLDDRLRRLDRSIYPHDIVREGLVNALAHRDYASFSGGVTIEVYPARVEIWNSGTLPDGWNAQRLRSPHPSLPSNPDIAQILYIRGFMERIGRGTLRMIQTCREEGLPAPQWRVDNDGITLTLFSRASRFAPEVNLNDRQRNLLAELSNGDQITVKSYHIGFAQDIGERQARRDLQMLADADLLRREGRRSTTRYVRTNRKV
jgi:ATP-dependent DNA helicase RecG